MSHLDKRGLVEEEEEDDDEEEDTLGEVVTRSQVNQVVDQIRQYDPSFRYATVAPPGYRYTQQDINNLRDILRQYQSDSSCRISYGSTPQGRPFSRHYGAETGPVRNLPGSVLDAIINGAQPIPGANGTTVYYDPVNGVTVVTGTNGIVSAHQGPPRSGDVL
jgi:hypothetical protein